MNKSKWVSFLTSLQHLEKEKRIGSRMDPTNPFRPSSVLARSRIEHESSTNRTGEVVTLCSFIAVFFSKAKTASVVGALLFFLLYFPFLLPGRKHRRVGRATEKVGGTVVQNIQRSCFVLLETNSASLRKRHPTKHHPLASEPRFRTGSDPPLLALFVGPRGAPPRSLPGSRLPSFVSNSGASVATKALASLSPPVALSIGALVRRGECRVGGGLRV